VLQSWLENIDFSLNPPCLNLTDDLRIRALLKSEKDEFRRHRPHDLKILAGSPTCVIETVTKGLGGDGEGVEAELEQESVLVALLLYRDRLVTRSTTTWDEGDFVTADEGQEYLRSSYGPLWRMFVALHHRFPLELNQEDKNEFRTFWGKLEKSQKKAPWLSMCLGRFLSASGMVADPGMDAYRLVDYVISMEALLTRNEGAMSFKLPLRMALLLGRSAQETAVVFEFMRLVYRLRSKLVHGDEMPPMQLRSVKIRPEEALGRLHSYSRTCIRNSLDLIDAGIDSKANLLSLIDLAAVRTDMRESLLAFLSGRQGSEKLKADFNRFAELTFQPELHEERHGVLD